MLDELGFHRLDVERHGQGRERLGRRLHRVGRAGGAQRGYSVPRRIKYPTSTPTPSATTREAARLSFISSSASCAVSDGATAGRDPLCGSAILAEGCGEVAEIVAHAVELVV